ncbi:hypothetical protein C8J57DRAFT_1506154 [Mycena rebaudengoi]|nr:hypothetical protein C8J57DRAFT_1506154 [Mycena rebaudengoi]
MISPLTLLSPPAGGVDVPDAPKVDAQAPHRTDDAPAPHHADDAPAVDTAAADGGPAPKTIDTPAAYAQPVAVAMYLVVLVGDGGRLTPLPAGPHADTGADLPLETPHRPVGESFPFFVHVPPNAIDKRHSLRYTASRIPASDAHHPHGAGLYSTRTCASPAALGINYTYSTRVNPQRITSASVLLPIVPAGVTCVWLLDAARQAWMKLPPPPAFTNISCIDGGALIFLLRVILLLFLRPSPLPPEPNRPRAQMRIPRERDRATRRRGAARIVRYCLRAHAPAALSSCGHIIAVPTTAWAH